MTHSTCCKAEKATDNFSMKIPPTMQYVLEEQGELELELNGKYYKLVSEEKLTPPPVPSEIEGEQIKAIAGVVVNMVKQGNEKYVLPHLQENITALITHHTSEKVKEEKERIKAKIDKLTAYGTTPECNVGNVWAFTCEDVYKVLATSQTAEGEGE